MMPESITQRRHNDITRPLGQAGRKTTNTTLDHTRRRSKTGLIGRAKTRQTLDVD